MFKIKDLSKFIHLIMTRLIIWIIVASVGTDAPIYYYDQYEKKCEIVDDIDRIQNEQLNSK